MAGLLLMRWAQKSNSGGEQDKGSPPPPPPLGVRMRCVRDEGNQGLYSGRRVIDLPTRKALLFGRNGWQELSRGRLRGARNVSLSR